MIPFALFILTVHTLRGIAFIINVYPLRARADRVDDHARALRHLHGRATRTIAAVVVAIGYDDQHTAYVCIRAGRQRRFGQQLLTGRVDRVIQRRAAAGALFQDRVAEVASVTRKILDDLGTVVKRHQERLIFSAADRVEQKVDRGVLFELQALANAIRSVQHHADAERQIGRLAEGSDFLLCPIIENFEVLFIQIGD